MATGSAATNWDPAFLGLFLLLFAAVAIFAGAFPQGDRRWWTLLALLALLVIAGTLFPDGWGRRLLLRLLTEWRLTVLMACSLPVAFRCGRP